MRVNMYKLSFLASFIFMSFAFSQVSNYENEVTISRSQSKSRNMQNGDMEMGQDQQTRQCDDLCFEPRCSCDENYKRCCFGLPLPAKCGWAFIEGEYLYWKAYTVIPYAQFREPVPPFNFTGAATYTGDIKTVSMSGDSGYRLTLGIYFSNCSYGSVQYRYFSADGTDSFSDPSIEVAGAALSNSFDAPWDFFGLMVTSSSGPFSVSAKQRHREKVLDFDFNRLFTCGRYALTPFMGVRFAWVKSDLRVDYVRLVSGVLERSNHADVNKHMNLGVGLHSGLNTNTDLCWGFGLYTTSSLSVLVGQFQHRIRNEMFDVDEPQRATITENYKTTDFQTNFQLGVGLNWGTHFCKCCYYLGLKLGYEVNVWPNFFDNYNILVNGADPSTFFRYYTKSLLTHGLNVGLRFDF